MESKENILGYENIGKLVIRFAIPCVISMVVAALYNIVDQIFIGWSEAGAYGNAATNIVYPVTVFALGFALLIGDGASANFSLFLGAKDNNKANASIGNGILLLVGASLLITAVCFLFKGQILSLFGADPREELCYAYAVDYYNIICLGIPFYMIGQGLNGSIRADGSPKYAMACTLAGAVANIILDPIFIFALHQGVKGAAIATVIGQVITFAISIVYLFRSRSFKLRRDAFNVDRGIITKIASVGLASLIVQLSIVVIIAVNNNLFTRYGYETVASTGNAYGAVIPLAVVGIVLKVFGIVVSIAIGIGLGGQPIIGYNMGAGNMDRVKSCIGYVTKAVLLVGAAAMLIFELFPGAIIAIFGKSSSPEYTEFARLCIRIFLGGIMLTCYIKAGSIILQSMGNSVKSTVTALTRDVIVFVPATVIIALASHSIVSMLWAALISDVIGSLTALLLIHTEIERYTGSASRLSISDIADGITAFSRRAYAVLSEKASAAADIASCTARRWFNSACKWLDTVLCTKH